MYTQVQVSTIPTHPIPLTYPEAICPSRLQWLCQPEQIEHTLCLLYYLNSWRKASQQLLYADRQSLLILQIQILMYAVQQGLVHVTTYLDGTRRFPQEILRESVAENVARGLFIHMKRLQDPNIWSPFYSEGDRLFQLYIRPLYRRITGRDFKLVTDAMQALERDQIRAYIQDQLDKLIDCAKVSRQPLQTRHLSALCIAPVDILHIRDNRVYFLEGFEAWDGLTACDRRKLDPEGFSEFAFRYISSTADFVFHLPFRETEAFITPLDIRNLQRTPGTSQPCGIYHNQPINEVESTQRPVREILQDLGVDISLLCPHKLVEKEAYLAQPAIHDILWPGYTLDTVDWDDDPWDGMCIPQQLV